MNQASASTQEMAIQSLLRAAEILAQPGKWMQGNRNGSIPSDCHCLATVLGAALPPGLEGHRHLSCMSEMRRRLYAAIGQQTLVDWNDRPGRTLDEVLAALKKAARKEIE